MKCSLGISNFLEEISSLSHSVVFQGWEDPLEKEMATHSSILPHGRRSLVGYGPWGHKGSDTTE